MKIKISLLIPVLLLAFQSMAQPRLVDREKYKFLNFSCNKLYFPDSSLPSPLFKQLKRLMLQGDEQINIVHIGDSHIQADYFSGKIRELFQSTFPGGNGGRGFVFPYNLAHTNNPSNYKISYTGTWTGCRNVQRDRDCLLGLSGISATSTSSLASFSIAPANSDELIYDFSRVRLYYEATDSLYEIELEADGETYMGEIDTTYFYIEWNLLSPVSEANFKIKKIKEGPSYFTVMGVALETRDPGIIYHSVGVNGAEVSSFLKCQRLTTDLKSLHPNLIIISLGTNDAYLPGFSESLWEENYGKFIEQIKLACPKALIVLTTPGDCYRYRKYPNPNNKSAGQVIFSLSKKWKVGVWDLYCVMGGLGSVQEWYTAGLTAKDRIHLSRAGYYLQSELFYEAFLAAFDQYLD